MAFITLAVAILAEVGATLSLRMGSKGSKLWFIPVMVLYPAAFALLYVTLGFGMSIGVAYGIWTALGVLLTAIAGRVLFKESITWVMALGLSLIVGGVFLVGMGK